MLYIPLVVGAGIAGNFNAPLFVLTVAVTLVFLSQRPYAQLVSSPAAWNDHSLRRRNLAWLTGYWVSTLSLFSWLYFGCDLVKLPQFLWLAIPIAAAFTLFLRKNQVRSVAGELTGILGLTLTAPLAHYAAVGSVQPVGFYLWALCILYFGSSVFFVKALITSHLKARLKGKVETAVTTRACIVYHAGLVLLLLSLASLERIPLLTIVAFAPVVARGFWMALRPQRKLNFARIGWTEVVYSLFFAIATILSMRVNPLAQ